MVPDAARAPGLSADDSIPVSVLSRELLLKAILAWKQDELSESTRYGTVQKYLGHYLAFFEFLHNARRRGKAVLHALGEALVARPQNAS